MKRQSNYDSFLKIVVYGSKTFESLNQSRPIYRDKYISVENVEQIATDKDGNPLFCYELVFVD